MDRVLIVDGEQNIRWTLSEAISSLPVEVDTAEDGEQALQKVGGDRVALILLDRKERMTVGGPVESVVAAEVSHP